jgi:hypothetical protein
VRGFKTVAERMRRASNWAALQSADVLVTFANLPAAQPSDAALVREAATTAFGDLPSFRAPTVREWNNLRRQTRSALGLLAEGRDPRPLIHQLNRSGGLSWQLEASRGASGWRIKWVPPAPKSVRVALMQALALTATVSDRIGCCEQCARFFLRAKKHRQRFCTGRCSTAFHNRRRLESGYFRERRVARRQRRAGDQGGSH